MKKVILNLAISIDGYIADNNHKVDWIQGDDPNNNVEQEKYFANFLSNIETIIMGHKAYEVTTSFAPLKEQFPGKDIIVLTSEKIEGLKTYDKDIENLVEESQENIWCFGGANMAKQFLDKRLITHLELAIIPATIGKGVRLFKESDIRDQWKLTNIKTMNGIAILSYERK